jgi:GxxExxY protein
MDTNQHEIVYKDLSYQIIKASLEVHNILGAGFLEKVYENALIIKLKQYSIKAEQQVPLKVCFEGETVGDYYADIVVDNKIILELKCVESIIPIHEAQLINYLKATRMKLGMIFNFARPKFEYKRIVL